MRQSLLQANGVVLKEVNHDDLDTLRTWRNDPAIAQYMLTQPVITPKAQQNWFEKIEKAEDQQYFVILYKHQKIGVANIKGDHGGTVENQQQLETGLYIGVDQYRGSFLAFCPALTLNDYCFYQLACQKLVATVLPENTSALRFNESLGYTVAEQSDLIKMELTKPTYLAASAKIRRFIR